VFFSPSVLDVAAPAPVSATRACRRRGHPSDKAEVDPQVSSWGPWGEGGQQRKPGERAGGTPFCHGYLVDLAFQTVNGLDAAHGKGTYSDRMPARSTHRTSSLRFERKGRRVSGKRESAPSAAAFRLCRPAPCRKSPVSDRKPRAYPSAAQRAPPDLPWKGTAERAGLRRKVSRKSVPS